jgi:chlorosome envelope protein B
MANETANDFSGAINNLVEAVGKLGQMQIDMITSGIKSATAAFEPLSKTSSELTGNVIKGVTEVLQNVTAAVTPKK